MKTITVDDDLHADLVSFANLKCRAGNQENLGTNPDWAGVDDLAHDIAAAVAALAGAECDGDHERDEDDT